MSATLELAHRTGPLESARADVVVVPLFAGERPLRDSAGRADWRLCGQLSKLLARGRLTGKPGEAVLVPTFGGLRAPLLLALGLGERRDFRPEDVAAFAQDATRRCVRLRAETAVLPLPRGDSLLRDRMVALVRGAALALAEEGGAMRLFVSASGPELARAGSVLAGLGGLELPVDVVVQVVPPAREAAVVPAGNRLSAAAAVK